MGGTSKPKQSTNTTCLVLWTTIWLPLLTFNRIYAKTTVLQNKHPYKEAVHAVNRAFPKPMRPRHALFGGLGQTAVFMEKGGSLTVSTIHK